MNNYNVLGTSQQVGAIGLSEPFDIRIMADSSKEAYNRAREGLYADNRELVHVVKVSVECGHCEEWVEVEPRAYL